MISRRSSPGVLESVRGEEEIILQMKKKKLGKMEKFYDVSRCHNPRTSFIWNDESFKKYKYPNSIDLKSRRSNFDRVMNWLLIICLRDELATLFKFGIKEDDVRIKSFFTDQEFYFYSGVGRDLQKKFSTDFTVYIRNVAKFMDSFKFNLCDDIFMISESRWNFTSPRDNFTFRDRIEYNRHHFTVRNITMAITPFLNEFEIRFLEEQRFVIPSDERMVLVLDMLSSVVRKSPTFIHRRKLDVEKYYDEYEKQVRDDNLVIRFGRSEVPKNAAIRILEYAMTEIFPKFISLVCLGFYTLSCHVFARDRELRISSLNILDIPLAILRNARKVSICDENSNYWIGLEDFSHAFNHLVSVEELRFGSFSKYSSNKLKNSRKCAMKIFQHFRFFKTHCRRSFGENLVTVHLHDWLKDWYPEKANLRFLSRYRPFLDLPKLRNLYFHFENPRIVLKRKCDLFENFRKVLNYIIKDSDERKLSQKIEQIGFFCYYNRGFLLFVARVEEILYPFFDLFRVNDCVNVFKKIDRRISCTNWRKCDGREDARWKALKVCRGCERVRYCGLRCQRGLEEA